MINAKFSLAAGYLLLATALFGCGDKIKAPELERPKTSCDGMLPLRAEFGTELATLDRMTDVEDRSLPLCGETVVDVGLRRARKAAGRYLVLLTGAHANACTMGYAGELSYEIDPKDGKAYYSGWSANGKYERIEVNGADTASISARRSIMIYSEYAVDKSSVFFRGRALAGADRGKLEIQSNGFADDGRSAFIGWSPVEKSEVCVLRRDLWRTNHRIFYKLEPTANDVATFESLGGRYFKDETGIYCDDDRTLSKIDADPATFAYVEEDFGTSVARDSRREFRDCR